MDASITQIFFVEFKWLQSSTLGSGEVSSVILNSESFHYVGIGRIGPDLPKAEQNLFTDNVIKA